MWYGIYMEKKLIQLGLMLVSFTLMVQPLGIPIYTYVPEGPPDVTFVSYFSSVPPTEYLNFSPIFIAIMSIIVIVRVAISLIVNYRKGSEVDNPGRVTMVCLILCLLATLASWGFFSGISIVGGIVFSLHAAALICDLMTRRGYLYN